MTVSELYIAVTSENPIQPVIRMGDSVYDLENYLEPGMMARVVGAQHDGEVIEFKIVLTEFDEYNKQFEDSNYFDKNGVPCLSAREAGEYSETMSFFVDVGFDVSGLYEIVSQELGRDMADPVKTFEAALRKAQEKRPSDFRSYSINNIEELALDLFMKADLVSPLAIATRSCLKSLASSKDKE